MEGTRFFGYPLYKLEFFITHYPTRFLLYDLVFSLISTSTVLFSPRGAPLYIYPLYTLRL